MASKKGRRQRLKERYKRESHYIAQLQAATQRLEESELHFRTLADKGSALIWTSGLDTLCDYFNAPWLAFTGRPLEQELGNGWAEGVHPEDFDRCLEVYVSSFEQRKSFSMDYRLRHVSGEYRWIRDDGNPRYDTKGQFIGYIGHCMDIHTSKLAEAQLKLAASVFTHAYEGIIITDAQTRIIEVNQAFSSITGYQRDEILGKTPKILSSGRQSPDFYEKLWDTLLKKGHWSGEIWNRRKNGEVYAELLTISRVPNAQDKQCYYVALFSDITALKEHQKQLENMAHYDPLTGLPNRLLFANRLDQAMQTVQRKQEQLAVVYIDLDGFKQINDTYGHSIGDELLMNLAQKMRKVLKEGDTIARLGGDEFAAVLLNPQHTEDQEGILFQLLEMASEPIYLHSLCLKVSASIGVAFFPQADHIDADQLLRQADHAMYQAKLGGKNRLYFFDSEKHRDIKGKIESIERIRLGLVQDEFILHYQPKVNLRTGEVIGVEALVRWQHPEQGFLPPAVFLPVMEDHPISIEFGHWVIDTALTQIETWLKAGLDLPVSVNVSAKQLQETHFIEELKALLAKHPQVKPSSLELEVLETSALEDMDKAAWLMRACNGVGIRFSLDDFGTGYSSLRYLKRLPAEQLKIDQSFVRDMLDDTEDLAILEGVLGLATAFRREVIAEGVETAEHGEMLLRLGCELAQGYGIARPMPPERLPQWIDSWQRDFSWQTPPALSREALPLVYATVEHRSWVRIVEECLYGKRAIPAAFELHQCRFGKWLEGEGKPFFPTPALFETVDNLHGRIHHAANTLLMLQSQGLHQQAVEGLPALHQLSEQLTHFLRERLDAEGNTE